jgi:hypothetical protein
MATLNTIHSFGVTNIAPPSNPEITVMRIALAALSAEGSSQPGAPCVEAGTLTGDLSRRFLLQQQAQLDELFRQGDIDHAIGVLAAQVGIGAGRDTSHRLPVRTLRDSRRAA